MRRSLYLIYLFTLASVSESVREAQFSCPNPDASGGADAEGSCVATAATAASSDGGTNSNTNGLNQPLHSATASSSTSKFSSERMQQFSTAVDDEATLLDLFGEAAKELLTKHVIPPTDAQCRWDWRHLRCEPYCDCAFSPLYGDYSLGRACRIRYEYFEGRDTCHLPPNTPYVKAFASVAHGLQVATTKTARLVQNVARKTDIKRRVINMRRRVCSSWEDRAALANDSMKRWQARICQGYDRSEEVGEDTEQHGSDEDEERADAEAADIAAKIANAKNGLSSVADVKEAVQTRKEKEAMGSRMEIDDETKLGEQETRSDGEELHLETS